MIDEGVRATVVLKTEELLFTRFKCMGRPSTLIINEVGWPLGQEVSLKGRKVAINS